MRVDYKTIAKRTRKLFVEYEKSKIEKDENRQAQIFDQIVELNIPIVNFILRKFLNRGENLDDIRQVGCIGLIKAVERYDINRGFEFSTFASATIEGEIRRYFRDRVPIIRVPRSLKELSYKIYQVIEPLTIELGHEPTIDDISRELSVSTSKIIDALNIPSDVIISLDTPLSVDEGSASIIDSIPCKDENIELVHNLDMLRPALECLNEFELKVINMRFWREMTQSQIADALDISQMHVSRILRKSLAKMGKYVSRDYETKRIVPAKQKNSNKTYLASSGISSYGVVVPAQPKGIKSLNIFSSILKFKEACNKEEFELDELCDFMWSCGVAVPKEVLLSFSGRIIFPSRAEGLWRFEPDSSPVFAEDILVHLVCNLEKITHKEGALV